MAQHPLVDNARPIIGELRPLVIFKSAAGQNGTIAARSPGAGDTPFEGARHRDGNRTRSHHTSRRQTSQFEERPKENLHSKVSAT